jgi:hypothetical protein
MIAQDFLTRGIQAVMFPVAFQEFIKHHAALQIVHSIAASLFLRHILRALPCRMRLPGTIPSLELRAVGLQVGGCSGITSVLCGM